MTPYTPDQCRHLVRLVLNTGVTNFKKNVPLPVFRRPEFRERFPERTPEMYAKMTFVGE
ncbi:hypothetical protein CRE_24128 [Caenorhabditis remanei]|uniref:Uncharacterized protein n=1 Tax=Caenorhabditis remanei TaxID=31234 RepID=E3N430_CAERE|nr:hypothetical protein CRE_24128 [Caenorhabditis remanei]